MAGNIKIIESNKPNVLAFSLEGKLSAEQMHAMAEIMNEMFDQYESVHMLVFLHKYKGHEIRALFDPKLIIAKVKEFVSIEKFAVVGTSTASELALETFASILSVDAEAFDVSQKNDAWEFVDASPVKEVVLA